MVTRCHEQCQDSMAKIVLLGDQMFGRNIVRGEFASHLFVQETCLFLYTLVSNVQSKTCNQIETKKRELSLNLVG